MKIDKQKIAELASLSDDKLWAEIVSIGAAHGFNMPRAVPPHAELEKLRAAVSGDKMKLGEAMKILQSIRREKK